MIGEVSHIIVHLNSPVRSKYFILIPASKLPVPVKSPRFPELGLSWPLLAADSFMIDTDELGYVRSDIKTVTGNTDK